jgi:hypothetical protein
MWNLDVNMPKAHSMFLLCLDSLYFENLFFIVQYPFWIRPHYIAVEGKSIISNEMIGKGWFISPVWQRFITRDIPWIIYDTLPPCTSFKNLTITVCAKVTGIWWAFNSDVSTVNGTNAIW